MDDRYEDREDVLTVHGTYDFCYNQLVKFQGTWDQAKELAKSMNCVDVVLR